MPKPALILFRSTTANDQFLSEFEDGGWSVVHVPVLDFMFVNQQALESKLSWETGVGGLIITSPRAATALAHVCHQDAASMAFCKQVDIVCTGKRTAAALTEIGVTPMVSSEADARGVARHVIAMQPKKRWLFLSGNLRRPELPALLTEAGLPFSELEVYQTLPQTGIALDKLNTPDWVGFFSPSGVNIVRQTWPGGWEAVKKAAIGATTAKAIRAAGWQVDAVAATPEAVALRLAIEHAMHPGADTAERINPQKRQLRL